MLITKNVSSIRISNSTLQELIDRLEVERKRLEANGTQNIRTSRWPAGDAEADDLGRFPHEMVLFLVGDVEETQEEKTKRLEKEYAKSHPEEIKRKKKLLKDLKRLERIKAQANKLEKSLNKKLKEEKVPEEINRLSKVED